MPVTGPRKGLAGNQEEGYEVASTALLAKMSRMAFDAKIGQQSAQKGDEITDRESNSDEESETEDRIMGLPLSDQDGPDFDVAAQQSDHIPTTLEEAIRQGAKESQRPSPRQYQLQLFERAKRENVIACLDTGSGKTYISVLLLEYFNSQETFRHGLGAGTTGTMSDEQEVKRRRSVFIVNAVPLVHQQTFVIDTTSTLRVAKLFGEHSMGLDLLAADSWNYLFDAGPYDVIMATAQVILDALNRAFIRMSDINLIVFDEAHHAVRQNNYARIMETHYRNTPVSERPHVFGMTASPLNSKDSFIQAAKSLQDTLDAKIFTASPELKADLELHSSRPKVIVLEYDEPSAHAKTSATTALLERACSFEHSAARKYIDRMRYHDREHGALVAEMAWQASRNEFEARANRKSKRIRTISSRIDALQQSSDDTQESEQIVLQEALKEKLQGNKLKLAQEAAANAAIGAILKTGRSLSKPFAVDASNATPKVLLLIDLLVAIGSQAQIRDTFCGIIFVQTKRTAMALQNLLKGTESLTDWLRPEWLTGHSEQVEEGMDWKQQQDVIRRFGQKGEVNLIVATNVVEEGLDVRPCNFVIRFDLFATHVSYVQSKGRARHKESRYIILASREKREHKELLREILEIDKEVEKWRRELPNEQKASHMCDEEAHDEEIEDNQYILRSPSSGAELRPLDCVSLLHYYTSVLPTDGSSPLNPEFLVEKGMNEFRHTVVLPARAKVQSATGPWCRTQRRARQLAAFVCAQKLYNEGELDHRLLPRKSYKVSEVIKKQCAPGCGPAKDLSIAHDITAQVPSFFGRLPLMHQVAMPLKLQSVRLPLAQANSESCDILLLTSHPIENLPGVRLFTNEVIYIPAVTDAQELCFNVEEMRLASHYTYILLCYMTRLGVQEACNEGEKVLKVESLPYYLLPALSGYQSDTPDWDQVERGTKELWKTAKAIMEESTSQEAISQNYTIFEQPTLLHNVPFCAAKICESLRPTSAIEGQEKTALDVIQGKRKREDLASCVDVTQPLLLCQRYPNQRNLLQSLRTNETFVPDSSIKSSYLIPQFVYAMPISTKMATCCTMLPSLLCKYEQALLARDLNRNVLGSCITNEAILSEALTFPSLNYETSYEVLEFVGDAVLGLVISAFIFAQDSRQNEGELTIRAQSLFCNERLTEISLNAGIPSYCVTRSFNRRSWRPSGMQTKPCKMAQKGIADLVESIVGAAWQTGGIATAFECISHLGLAGRKVNQQSLQHTLAAQPHGDHEAEQWQERADAGALLRLQDELNYTFRDPLIAFEACTHSSSIFAGGIPSYERLEFLGDKVLSLLVIETLLEHMPNHREGAYTPIKGQIVSNASLTIACIDSGLYKFLQHNDAVMARNISDFRTRVEQERSNAPAMDLDNDAHSTCTLSTILRGPKQLADLIEALLGGVYVDSGFDLDSVRSVYNKILLKHALQYLQ